MKYIVLTITLVVPLVAYLFLKNFGENKYAIPIYYQDIVEREVSGCFQFSLPHHVNFSAYKNFGIKAPVGLTIINPVFDSCFDCAPNLNNVKRVVQKHEDINVLSLYVQQITSFKNSQNSLGKNWFIREVNLPDLISILRCELLFEIPSKTSITELNEKNQLVLIDEQNRIRGYYAMNDREEIDRLILEISILKQE